MMKYIHSFSKSSDNKEANWELRTFQLIILVAERLRVYFSLEVFCWLQRPKSDKSASARGRDFL